MYTSRARFCFTFSQVRPCIPSKRHSVSLISLVQPHVLPLRDFVSLFSQVRLSIRDSVSLFSQVQPCIHCLAWFCFTFIPSTTLQIFPSAILFRFYPNYDPVYLSYRDSVSLFSQVQPCSAISFHFSSKCNPVYFPICDRVSLFSQVRSRPMSHPVLCIKISIYEVSSYKRESSVTTFVLSN